MKNCLKLRLLVLVLLLPSGLFAQDSQQRPTIDVQGSADVKVIPDQVFIVFGIETSDPNLTVSKSSNDERARKLLALTKDLNIDPRYVQTDFISIEPWEHELRDENRTVRLEYRVRKNMAVTLNDIGKFEELLSRALLGGVNHVHGIQFRTTELRKHRDHAREMAIQAAKEKAALLAGKLGRQVGPAFESPNTAAAGIPLTVGGAARATGVTRCPRSPVRLARHPPMMARWPSVKSQSQPVSVSALLCNKRRS